MAQLVRRLEDSLARRFVSAQWSYFVGWLVIAVILTIIFYVGEGEILTDSATKGVLSATGGIVGALLVNHVRSRRTHR